MGLYMGTHTQPEIHENGEWIWVLHLEPTKASLSTKKLLTTAGYTSEYLHWHLCTIIEKIIASTNNVHMPFDTPLPRPCIDRNISIEILLITRANTGRSTTVDFMASTCTFLD